MVFGFSGMPVPRRLKARLALNGWGYADLAIVTGYAVQTLRNVASGESSNPRVQRKISEALGEQFWPLPPVCNTPAKAPQRRRKRGVLHHALKLRGMTAAELAKRIGVGVRTVHNLSCGNHRSPRTRQLIEAILKMHIWSEAPKPFSVSNPSYLEKK